MGRLDLDGYTDKCVRMLNDLINPRFIKADKRVPATLINHCQGIAFITIVKAGWLFIGGNIGAGCVIAKVKDENSPRGWRWSGPTSVVCGGLGGGVIFGGQKCDSLIILNTKQAVKAFMGLGQVTLGGNVAVTAGPIGREIEAHVGASQNKKVVAAYSYSKTQGLFFGATLEGAILIARNSDNVKFYNDPSATPEKVLKGQVRTPLAVEALHKELYAIHERKGDYSALEKEQSIHSNSDPFSSGMSADAELEPGWSKTFTVDGQPYYYHEVTKETRWDAPLAKDISVASSSNPSYNPAYAEPSVPLGPGVSSHSDKLEDFGGSDYSTASWKKNDEKYNSRFPDRPSASTKPNYSSGHSATAAGKYYDERPSGVEVAQGIPLSNSRPTMPPRPAAPIRAAPQLQASKPTATALYPYTASNSSEISFNTDDVMEVVDKSDMNWYRVRFRGQEGYAPANYLRM